MTIWARISDSLTETVKVITTCDGKGSIPLQELHGTSVRQNTGGSRKKEDSELRTLLPRTAGLRRLSDRTLFTTVLEGPSLGAVQAKGWQDSTWLKCLCYSFSPASQSHSAEPLQGTSSVLADGETSSFSHRGCSMRVYHSLLSTLLLFVDS